MSPSDDLQGQNFTGIIGLAPQHNGNVNNNGGVHNSKPLFSVLPLDARSERSFTTRHHLSST